jgi:hypothetical protein
MCTEDSANISLRGETWDPVVGKGMVPPSGERDGLHWCGCMAALSGRQTES